MQILKLEVSLQHLKQKKIPFAIIQYKCWFCLFTNFDNYLSIGLHCLFAFLKGGKIKENVIKFDIYLYEQHRQVELTLEVIHLTHALLIILREKETFSV